MSRSPRLDLPFVLPQQAQKHLTVNDAMRRLDAIVQTAVFSASTVSEPAAARAGDLYILPPSATGARWSAMKTGALALFEDGAFVEMAPVAGQIAYVVDTGAFLLFDGASWTDRPFRPRQADHFAVNADPSDANRLTVAADSELLTHDARTPGSGDARKVINKAGSARTASVVFQSAFSGRAEIGLAGSDDLTIRVSADGSAFRDALRISAANGRVALGRAEAPVCALDVGGPVRVASYARNALPSPAGGSGQIVYVSDEAGGAVLAFSDGSVWRRVTDRAPVS
ncbi:DUF2793 domain-containing protein [Aureimonas sp. AU40]|uniref:DUF2793 domain-containing protein n=1 Tax=Aureimonas sp. AU40 TaxID=1637747 RepID=UPI00078591FB|nr:DUF2793 domain-containing protein [Aureimonas sp. AU40]